MSAISYNISAADQSDTLNQDALDSNRQSNQYYNLQQKDQSNQPMAQANFDIDEL